MAETKERHELMTNRNMTNRNMTNRNMTNRNMISKRQKRAYGPNKKSAATVSEIQNLEFSTAFTFTPDGDLQVLESIYVPPAYEVDGNLEIDGDNWAALNGYSNQYSYSGPILHESETLSQSMVDDMIEMCQDGPVVFSMVVVDTLDEEYEDDPTVGWAILYSEQAVASRGRTSRKKTAIRLLERSDWHAVYDLGDGLEAIVRENETFGGYSWFCFITDRGGNSFTVVSEDTFATLDKAADNLLQVGVQRIRQEQRQSARRKGDRMATPTRRRIRRQAGGVEVPTLDIIEDGLFDENKTVGTDQLTPDDNVDVIGDVDATGLDQLTPDEDQEVDDVVEVSTAEPVSPQIIAPGDTVQARRRRARALARRRQARKPVSRRQKRAEDERRESFSTAPEAKAAIEETLGEWADDFDIDAIFDQAIEYQNGKYVWSVDFEEYWKIVEQNDKTAKRTSRRRPAVKGQRPASRRKPTSRRKMAGAIGWIQVGYDFQGSDDSGGEYQVYCENGDPDGEWTAAYWAPNVDGDEEDPTDFSTFDSSEEAKAWCEQQASRTAKRTSRRKRISRQKRADVYLTGDVIWEGAIERTESLLVGDYDTRTVAEELARWLDIPDEDFDAFVSYAVSKADFADYQTSHETLKLSDGSEVTVVLEDDGMDYFSNKARRKPTSRRSVQKPQVRKVVRPVRRPVSRQKRTFDVSLREGPYMAAYALGAELASQIANPIQSVNYYRGPWPEGVPSDGKIFRMVGGDRRIDSEEMVLIAFADGWNSVAGNGYFGNRKPISRKRPISRKKKAETYNGWTNWDTWNVYGWLTNDYDTYEKFRKVTSIEELKALAMSGVVEEPEGYEVDWEIVDWNELWDALGEDRVSRRKPVRKNALHSVSKRRPVAMDEEDDSNKNEPETEDESDEDMEESDDEEMTEDSEEYSEDDSEEDEDEEDDEMDDEEDSEKEARVAALVNAYINSGLETEGRRDTLTARLSKLSDATIADKFAELSELSKANQGSAVGRPVRIAREGQRRTPIMSNAPRVSGNDSPGNDYLAFI